MDKYKTIGEYFHAQGVEGVPEDVFKSRMGRKFKISGELEIKSGNDSGRGDVAIIANPKSKVSLSKVYFEYKNEKGQIQRQYCYLYDLYPFEEMECLPGLPSYYVLIKD